MRLAIGLLAVVGAAATLPATAEECPASILSAVEKLYKGGKAMGCLRETDDDETYFVVNVQTQEGKKLELDLTPDGGMIETVEYITAAEIPPAVMKGLLAKYPGAKVTEVDRVTDHDGEVTFDIEFTAGDRKQEITLTSTGEVYEFESDEDDDGGRDRGD